MNLPRAEISAKTGFAGGHIDRCGEKRGDAAYLARAEGEAEARLVLVTRDGPLGGPEGPVIPLAGQIEAIDRETLVFLGRDEAGPLFSAAPAGDPPAGFEVLDLRRVLYDKSFDRLAVGLLAASRSMTGWHLGHRFCAACGAPTRIAEGGWKRHCEGCGRDHFPRTDPVTIMLVIDPATGDVLLGRQPQFMPGVLSCLAGFVEPGETIEDAVRREVMEEAGIAVGQVRYIASQPWPFPSSLMIGCFAEALSRAITMDASELEEVRFVTRAELAARAATRPGEGEAIPPSLAIAHTLARHYLDLAAPPFG
ncbi:MAG: NAD(+) diphosphatase [Hyphomicrobiaceae bacterium]|nr:NAD(+) diphosphatase [Hyphomicrobiaceae bacterium]